MNMKTIGNGLLGMALVSLVGCGGGGGGGTTPGSSGPSYSGVTTPAAVTATNAEGLGTAAAESTAQAVAKTESLFGVAISNTPSATLSKQQIGDIILRIRASLASANNLPIGITIFSSDMLNMDPNNTGPGAVMYCGGSLTGPDDLLTNTSMSGSATLTLNKLCVDVGSVGKVIMSGQVYVSVVSTAAQDSDTTVVTYKNFTVSINGQTQTLNGTETCVYTNSTGLESCTSTEDFVGGDGLTYQIQDVNVSGDATSGYSVGVTVYHPTYGYVTVTTIVPITFNCPNGKPGVGEISFAGSGGSFGTITFDNCTTYTVSYDDGSGTVNSIPGTW